jgi:hypothetical protein
MAKVIKPMVQNSKEKPIKYSDRKVGDGYTHNVRSKKIKI